MSLKSSINLNLHKAIECCSLHREMGSLHFCSIYSGNKEIVSLKPNYVTGRPLNCHAEQHALMSLLILYGYHDLLSIFNFTTLLTEKKMSRFLWGFKEKNTT
jgi:hypothetical protein